MRLRDAAAGALIYDITAAALLAYAGFALDMTGLALWPAVGLLVALSIWCAICFVTKPVPMGKP
jgi:hypothetical protein